jgi:choline dehydrogenase
VSPDVLIVGAGSAGLFAALGLAASARVTLVEAGADAGTPPPGWMLYDYLLPEACYYHYTDAGTGMDLPQGRGTGGGSTVNSAAALRGQPWDFDGWNVPGWSWEEVLPGFRAIEADRQFGAAPFHGTTGPIPVTRLRPGPLDDAFMSLALKRDHPAIEDHNAPGALGIGTWPTNRMTSDPVSGGRWGTHAAVLPLIRDRVDLRTDTTVERLVFEGTRCVGADVTGPGGAERILAGHVVLCAGAFGTPLLLIRSGIGPEGNVVRLPGVGENLQDHPWCLLDVDVTDVSDIAARPVSGSLLRYELSDGDHNEVEIFPWQTRPYVPSAPATQVSFTAALMTPLSRGCLSLGPGGPVVESRHLSRDRDAATMASVVAETAGYLDELAAAGLIRLPRSPWWREDDLAAACHRNLGTYNHHSGTCRLGLQDADGTVVTPRLNVLGTQNLLVADSSILPVIPRANTNLTSMMIGHRAASFLAA